MNKQELLLVSREINTVINSALALRFHLPEDPPRKFTINLRLVVGRERITKKLVQGTIDYLKSLNIEGYVLPLQTDSIGFVIDLKTVVLTSEQARSILEINKRLNAH